MKSERISPFWVGGYHPFSAISFSLSDVTAYSDFSTAVPLRQKIPPAKREQEQKRAGSQRNQLQFLLQVGTCGRILSEKFTNMFRRLIPVIQLIKQFIFIDSGINVFAMFRLALAAMATSVAAVSASTFHFSVIFHFLRFFSLRQQSYDIFRYRRPKKAF